MRIVIVVVVVVMMRERTGSKTYEVILGTRDPSGMCEGRGGVTVVRRRGRGNWRA